MLAPGISRRQLHLGDVLLEALLEVEYFSFLRQLAGAGPTYPSGCVVNIWAVDPVKPFVVEELDPAVTKLNLCTAAPRGH